MNSSTLRKTGGPNTAVTRHQAEQKRDLKRMIEAAKARASDEYVSNAFQQPLITNIHVRKGELIAILNSYREMDSTPDHDTRGQPARVENTAGNERENMAPERTQARRPKPSPAPPVRSADIPASSAGTGAGATPGTTIDIVQ